MNQASVGNFYPGERSEFAGKTYQFVKLTDAVAATNGMVCEAASATDGTLVWNYDDPSGKNQYKKGDPIGLAEMARRKHEGQKAGLYDRNAIEA